MWGGFLTSSLLLSGPVFAASFPPHVDRSPPVPLAAGGVHRPANCTVIHDAELGQTRQGFIDAIPCFNVRFSDGLIRDALAADDFEAASPGRISDAVLYVLSSFDARPPAHGVRIYLWGSGDTPAEQPSIAVDVPPAQVRYRSLGWWLGNGFEIHATGLDIRFPAGRNWITIQPRDWAEGASSYFALRNYIRPLQGEDAFVRDGPDAEHPGYGFTDWRRSQDAGFGFRAADSYIRIEGCFDGMSIAVDGDCGGSAQFSWSNAPPQSTLTFLYARNTGEVRIPPNLPCGGTQLGLGQRRLQVAFSVETGGGSGMVERFLPAGACPGYFQALIREPTGPCEVSNVVGTP